jgi:serine O-acetyltransferase
MKSKKSLRNPIVFYYLANWFYCHHFPILPSLFQLLIFILFKAVIPYRVQIGTGCLLAHGGNGVVIHPDVRIGCNVLICHQVTIGGAKKNWIVPIIGNDVYIGAGAKIIGPVTIGDNCVIGVNAVVIRSVQSGCVVAGVPARVLHQGINAHDFEEW